MTDQLPDVPITELKNALGIVVATAAGIQYVIGCSEKGPLLTPALYGSAEALHEDFGEGDAVEDAALSVDQTGTPVGFIRVASDSPGSVDSTDVSGVTGTAIAAFSGTPLASYEPRVEVEEGGELGVDEISLRWALDDDRTPSAITALSGYSFTIPSSGLTIAFEPPAAQVTALIAAAVEARSDTLAHLADVTAHDAADTSAAQVALAASSVPTTEAQAWAVLNLCLAALAEHGLNITAHNGPDPVNVVAHAAATSGQTGIDLFVEYKAKWNAHLGIALAGSVAGLKAATATVAAPLVLTAADLLAPALALMAVYPRRLIVTTAGGTPANAPATLDIVGTDSADVVQSETLALAQTATTARSVKAYKTITSLSTPTADGTAATLAYGLDLAVHNSADVTNTIAAAAPTHGTLANGDVVTAKVTAPAWSAADIWGGTNPSALKALQSGAQNFEFVQIVGDMSADDAGVVDAGLASLRTLKRHKWALSGARLAAAAEAESAWITSLKTDYASRTKNDEHAICAGSHRVISAISGRQYTRPITGAVAARFVEIPIYVDAAKVSGENGGPLKRSKIFDQLGNPIAHNEAERGGLMGAGFIVLRTFPTKGEAPYIANPVLMSEAGSDFDFVQKRRVMNRLEDVVYDESLTIELNAEGDVDDETGFINEFAARDIELEMRAAIKTGLGKAISNPDDPALYILERNDPILTNGGELNASSRITPKFYIKRIPTKVGFKNPALEG